MTTHFLNWFIAATTPRVPRMTHYRYNAQIFPRPFHKDSGCAWRCIAKAWKLSHFNLPRNRKTALGSIVGLKKLFWKEVRRDQRKFLVNQKCFIHQKHFNQNWSSFFTKYIKFSERFGSRKSFKNAVNLFGGHCSTRWIVEKARSRLSEALLHRTQLQNG